MKTTQKLQLFATQVATVTLIAVLATSAWCKEQQRKLDDRGSDSTEKAFMVILAIFIGGAIALAVRTYINKKKGEIHD